MDFFGNGTFLNGVDDDFNELIKWLEDIDRPKNRYMEKEGLEILQKNGYISTYRIHLRASLLKGSKNNKERFGTRIEVKDKLKKDHLSLLVSGVISKFKESKNVPTKAELRTTSLCQLIPKACQNLVETIKNSDLKMGEKVALCSCLSAGGTFQKSWEKKLKVINVQLDNKPRGQLPADLIESYATWVWNLIQKNKKLEALFKEYFLKELEEWQKTQIENKMDVNTIHDVIGALIEHTVTFKFSDLNEKSKITPISQPQHIFSKFRTK